MRVRVLSTTTPPVVTPKLTKGVEVDLPDEQALAMIKAGDAEAVDYEDVGKVERVLDERQARADQLETDHQAAARKSATAADEQAARGRLDEVEATEARRVAAAAKAAEADQKAKKR